MKLGGLACHSVSFYKIQCVTFRCDNSKSIYGFMKRITSSNNVLICSLVIILINSIHLQKICGLTFFVNSVYFYSLYYVVYFTKIRKTYYKPGI